jgi:DnaJ homolog subfamily A member 5
MGAFHGRKIDYDNVPPKFFTELSDLFAKLASEEATAAKMEGEDIPEYPPFGDREDDYEDVVKPFYAFWAGFVTLKTYFWEDKYHTTDASDRRIRRAMEKENKKFRDDAIREFNDTVRMLIAFVRKRDPRYKPNFQTDAERQKALREASAAQAARSRAANEAKMQEHVPEWTMTRESMELNEDESEEEMVKDQFECVACRKTFKSEKQFEAHEKSKKHQQTVKALIRKMRKENDTLQLDDVVSSGVATPMQDTHEHDVHDQSRDIADEPEVGNAIKGLEISTDSGEGAIEAQDETVNANRQENKAQTTSEDEEDKEDDEDEDEDSNDEYGSREEVLSQLTMRSIDGEGNSVDKDEGDVKEDKPKLGKAAQKRARKAAQRAVTTDKDQEFRYKCARQGCDAAFPSRRRLFQHIEDLGHAAPVPQAEGKNKGKRS